VVHGVFDGSELLMADWLRSMLLATPLGSVAANYGGSDRRGPDRSQNLARPKFNAETKPRSTGAVESTVAVAKPGTDAAWSSF